MMTDRMLTVGELADMLAVSPTTVRRHIALGHVKAVRVGGVWRVPATEVDRIKSNGT